MTLWCPDGALFHPVHQLCISNQHAIGPFTPEMKKSCEIFRGSNAPECNEMNWDIYFAGVLRGAARCPPGTQFDSQVSACTDNSFGYGPFSSEQVDRCRSLQWAYTCEIMRWPLAILRGEKAPPAPLPSLNGQARPQWNPQSIRGFAGRLLAYYAHPNNYRTVHKQVMDWFGTTQNACVAFISTAMRNAGLPVPRKLNAKGYNISTWTSALSEYLEHNLGWQRIERLKELAGGDVVFTLDLDGSKRVPAHVFLFVEWVDATSTQARVIDNQGFLHERDLLGRQGFFTPFNYALRAPQ